MTKFKILSGETPYNSSRKHFYIALEDGTALPRQTSLKILDLSQNKKQSYAECECTAVIIPDKLGLIVENGLIYYLGQLLDGAVLLSYKPSKTVLSTDSKFPYLSEAGEVSFKCFAEIMPTVQPPVFADYKRRVF